MPSDFVHNEKNFEQAKSLRRLGSTNFNSYQKFSEIKLNTKLSSDISLGIPIFLQKSKY